LYAFACIILESDLEIDEYLIVNSEREGLLKAEKHVKSEKVCPHLKTILRGTLLRGRVS
jgi:hypothetical protein